MKYCINCLYPDTKPDLWFDESGLCAACIAFKERKNIDWRERASDFERIVKETKRLKRDYDCVVPVSGGKDSHYQVIKAREYGLNVLAVNATTDSLSILGRKNLDNISNLGVDCIEVALDKNIRKRCAKYALYEIGDCSYAEHISIFTVPIHIAKKFEIPLVIYGENPQSEYGGPKDSQQSKIINERWLSEFGGLNGLRVSDLVEQGLLPEDKATFYKYPKGELPRGIFLGQYFPWDGYSNALVAREHGFTWNDRPVEGIGFNYENLDNKQTGARDWLRYLKYGYGRATDLVCNHIRRGNITREQGIEHCKKWDGQYPVTYLGYSLEEIMSEIDVSVEHFINVARRFANKTLFDIGEENAFFGPFLRFEIGKGLK